MVFERIGEKKRLRAIQRTGHFFSLGGVLAVLFNKMQAIFFNTASHHTK